MYPIIDISSWENEEIYVSGSKEKRWYRNPQTRKLHLFKLPVSLTNDNWKIAGEHTGEMWSEKICSELGKTIGLDIHECNIARLELSEESINYYGINTGKLEGKELYGALCTSFLIEEKESLIEGADMIMEIDPSYDRKTLRGETEVYSYDLLERLFLQYGELEYLHRMIIFDTLVGNTDRHQDNFGMIRNELTKEVRMAPLYDNSSSLGRELPLRKVELMFKDSKMFNSYLFGRKASSLIKWGNSEKVEKLNAFELFKNVKSINPQIVTYIKDLKILTDSQIESIVNQVPTLVMDEVRKRFVSTVLKKRRDLILKEL
ncbi:MULTISPECIES: HipA domain-containing protein [Saccharibacillus]|uniref:HipA domain-containing protein n=1 Tax=Saccharibacillus TaxID=456492 RepID=UPI00123A9EE6|nr:HipA domain-containing protein [Saccharibacillus sp. WB 17]MWJ31501.1 phosphatidylinositol kinase [Saccharibacillus sp. WB 17]